MTPTTGAGRALLATDRYLGSYLEKNDRGVVRQYILAIEREARGRPGAHGMTPTTEAVLAQAIVDARPDGRAIWEYPEHPEEFYGTPIDLAAAILAALPGEAMLVKDIGALYAEWSRVFATVDRLLAGPEAPDA